MSFIVVYRFKSSNKHVNQVQKNQTLSCERTKFRKDYKIKVVQNNKM